MSVISSVPPIYESKKQMWDIKIIVSVQQHWDKTPVKSLTNQYILTNNEIKKARYFIFTSKAKMVHVLLTLNFINSFSSPFLLADNQKCSILLVKLTSSTNSVVTYANTLIPYLWEQVTYVNLHKRVQQSPNTKLLQPPYIALVSHNI